VRPLPHVQVLVVDKDGNPVAKVGASGALLVAGPGVARYLEDNPSDNQSGSNESGNETDTTGGFSTLNYSTRVVKTGDRATVLSVDEFSGAIASFSIQGREDVKAVKVRGQFVDLQAIEATFLQLFPLAGACAAVAYDSAQEGESTGGSSVSEGDGMFRSIGLAFTWPTHHSPGKGDPSTHLAAAAPSAASVRAALRPHLSSWAVPTRVVLVAALPADALAGKCDRRAVLALLTAGDKGCGGNGSGSGSGGHESGAETKEAGLTRAPSAVGEESAPNGCSLLGLEMTARVARISKAMTFVLGLKESAAVKPDDDFFSLGGHSAAAVRLCRELGCQVADLVRFPTPLALASRAAAAPPPEDLDAHVRASVYSAQAEAASAQEACGHRPFRGRPRLLGGDGDGGDGFGGCGSKEEDAAAAFADDPLVLLTGATGLLGGQIVDALAEAVAAAQTVAPTVAPTASVYPVRRPLRVVCLVRCASEAAAQARVAPLAQRGTPFLCLEALRGDASRPRLGLSPATWAALALGGGGGGGGNGGGGNGGGGGGGAGRNLPPHKCAEELGALAFGSGSLVVIHAAASVDAWAPLRALRGINVDSAARAACLVLAAAASNASSRKGAGSALHLVSSSASLPPNPLPSKLANLRPEGEESGVLGSLVVGGGGGSGGGTRSRRKWPERGGRWHWALEAGLHTSAEHGGRWEGYAQSKWAAEQAAWRTLEGPRLPVPGAARSKAEPPNADHPAFERAQLGPCPPSTSSSSSSSSFGASAGAGHRLVVHRFSSLAGDADVCAALAASLLAGCFPEGLQAVEWAPPSQVAKGVATAVAASLGPGFDIGGGGGLDGGALTPPAPNHYHSNAAAAAAEAGAAAGAANAGPTAAPPRCCVMHHGLRVALTDLCERWRAKGYPVVATSAEATAASISAEARAAAPPPAHAAFPAMVPASVWRRRIEQFGDWEAAVPSECADRIRSLAAAPSGLEGAIGLCERPLVEVLAHADDINDCADTILNLLKKRTGC